MARKFGKLVYFNDVEKERLERLAAEEKLSECEYIRLLIDRADREIIITPRKAKKAAEVTA